MPAASTQPPVKLSLPLQFQQDIYHLLRAEDVLVILARGLGLLKIVTNLLHSYDAAGNSLVIVVGAEDRENEWIGEALAEHYAISRSPLAKGLRVIRTDKATVAAREKMYSEGGIVSVTSRILIVDLLSKLLDPETVTGLVVLHAERVVATSTEAFIIRNFRQFNKIGFLKAFSDAPEPLTSSYAPLAAMMRNLFLRKPSLWPRFHVSIAQSLEGKKKADVIELEIPMTDAMRAIQTAVLECVEMSISELRKANLGLEMEDWTLDSALHTNFDAVVRRQLDPVWHRVSWRTKQIANDLTVLRSILHSLLSYDCVSLLKYLDTVHATHAPPPGSMRQDQSPWLFSDAAGVIFQTAKARVYRGKTEDTGALPASKLPDSLTPVLEEQPKWAVLAEILQEIEIDTYLNPSLRDDSNDTVLIMCNDERTCRQVKDYLQTMHVKPLPQDMNDGQAPHEVEAEEEKGSAEFMLRRKLREYLGWRKTFAQVSASLFEENQKSLNDIKGGTAAARLSSKGPANKRRRMRGGGSMGINPSRSSNGAIAAIEDKAAQVASLLAELRPTESESFQKEDVILDDLKDAGEDFFELYSPDDQIVVHPYDGDQDDLLLEEIRPKYIIMYSPSTDFIRRVEVYRSSHSDRSVRAYFMYYGGSVEEQRYLSAVRREKEAFTRLIKERGSMAVTLTDAGSIDPQEAFLRTVNTRIAGGGRLAATAAPPTVVVDVREFRSALPSLLHGRSMQIVPCQLTVGDYVLSPNICVERKSVRDLIASFKNGRLFNQAETMLQYYKYPFLLIEFDQNKSFTLDPFADLTSVATLKMPDSDTKDLQSKLVLLTLAFPRLKVIWSSSPYQTAEIFEELKKQQEEPDPLRAVQLGLAEDEDPDEKTFNTGPQDLLRTIPGVNNKNASRLYLEARNVLEVANMTLDELDPHVGKESGRQIVRFFTRSVFDDEEQ
ncbi:DNA excision repair protein ERCC-4 [Exophiala viscosa]|uniref:DNA excision repair protein ERCC-4 n=1 Tax=Exophiala viscosa TaxID=2486360 RepID=A0AAN6IH68_9EURO|nr:DNA excision repair protein ERCC-4 [Exophiala viscosa]KAI1626559.1 DNA excision repair protein ERCC-4 [Exophiala viscosa]